MDCFSSGIAPSGSPPPRAECPRLWRDWAAPGSGVDRLDEEEDDGVLDEALVGVEDEGVSLEGVDLAVGVDFALGAFAALSLELPSLPPPESAATAIPARTSATSAPSAIGRARLRRRRGAGRPSSVGGPERGGGVGGGGVRGSGVAGAGVGVAGAGV